MTKTMIPASCDKNKAEDARNESGPVPVFIVIGKTGVGKSSFIRLLGGRDMRSGQYPVVDGGINSCTSTLAAYQATVSGREIILLDTPGFDDSTCVGNLEIIIDIASSLYCFAVAEGQFRVHGAIFLHDTSGPRFTGSQRKTHSIPRDMCGERCMGNVIIGTTKWIPESPDIFLQQQRREQQFIEEHWSGICKTTRLFQKDADAVVGVVTDLLNKPLVSLLVQEEMLLLPHTIECTTVGKALKNDAIVRIKQLPTGSEERGVLAGSVHSLQVRPDLTFTQRLSIIIDVYALTPLKPVTVPIMAAIAGFISLFK